jgi:glutamyl-tRNA synthetase
MKTTKVVRGDEWLSSWPIHRELFKVCGFEEPEYIHIAPISKMEGASKRKLSKRKDPEAAVEYYREKGIPVDAVTEYLLTIANSNYEEWRNANPDAPNTAFELSLQKMSNSGALFDMVKLNDIAKEVIAKKSIDQCYEEIKAWAAEFNKDFYSVVIADREKFKQTIDLWKFTNGKVRKDVGMWSEIYGMFEYLYKVDWAAEKNEELLEKYGKENFATVLKAYEQNFAMADDRDQWFSDVKIIAEKVGYTGDRKAYKANPGKFKGMVGDFCAIVRIAITGKENSPDLFSIINILGECEVKRRLRVYM